MNSLRILFYRLRGLFLKRSLDQELDQEISSHLEMLIEDYQRQGMSADEARFAALRKFGGIDQLKENYRDKRSLPAIETLFRDLGFGFRMFSEEAMIALDAGRAFDGGKPPTELHFRDARIHNPRKDTPPRTILGVDQKAWFKGQLRRSTATWKIWGNSLGALDLRADLQNLPAGMVKNPWPADTYAQSGSNDYGSAYAERSEIYDLVRDSKITGFAIVSGDRHSFWAGYAAAYLPPRKFEPVGLSFVGASLASPGAMEAHEHNLKKTNPLRPLYLADRPDGAKPDWTFNMLLKHGVRSCLEYAKSFDLKRARSLSNPELSPHLQFVDMGGHGYATVRLTADEMRTEFVCIPRPIARSERADGGPIRYRVLHTAALWKSGERPQLKTSVLEGDAGLSI